MKKGAGVLFIIFVLFVLYQAVKSAASNVPGAVGIITAIISAVFLIIRKKNGQKLYWPIMGIIAGIFLTLSWAASKEWMAAFGLLFIFLFFYFLITAFIFAIRKITQWKHFSGLTVLAMILGIVFLVNAPESEQAATKQEISKEHTADSTSAVKPVHKVKPSTEKADKKETAHTKTKAKEDQQTTASVSKQEKSKTVHSPSQTNSHKKSNSNSKSVPAGLVNAVVTKEVDGDTIHVSINGRDQDIRMLLIDTPETHDPRKPVEPLGPEASSFARKEMPVGSHVKIEEGVKGHERDKYGRLLAYIYLPNGKMYNEEAVKKGLARVAYIYPPNTKHLSALRKDENYAKSRHLGIWSIKGYVTSSGYNIAAKSSSSNHPAASNSTVTAAAPKTNSSSSTEKHSSSNAEPFQNNPADDKESNVSCKGKIKGNANSKIYHVPGGEYYDRTVDNIVWFCSEADAQKAGYRHSKR